MRRIALLTLQVAGENLKNSHAGFIVGIKMHTSNMALAQAQDFFKQGYSPQSVALIKNKGA